MSLIVETVHGRLAGSDEGDLAVFRGVRFAAAPAGEHRFAAPRPVQSWTGVRSALAFGPAAPQSPREGFYLPGTSEDCLSLNIWTPGIDRRLPVVVWSPGGAFLTGSGAEPRYEGAGLARHGDVVVVTVNYRLGALGFLYLDGLVGSEFPWVANAGLLDMVAALEWVRDNIGTFGGDPENVTFVGQSSGGMAVADLMAMPAARGLFHRAIAQSGAGDDVASSEEAERLTRQVLNELGLSEHEAERIVEVPLDALLAAQDQCHSTYMRRRFGLSIRPVIDGAVLPEHPRAALVNGNAMDVPLLVGSTLDEWRRMGDPPSFDLNEAGLLNQLGEALGGHAEFVEHAYRTERPEASPTELWFAIETDRCFRIPAIWLADAANLRRPDRTYMYLFTWPSPIAHLRSCHGIDVPFVLGSFDSPGMRELVGPASRTASLERAVQDAWSAFARTGNPNVSALPEWPVYEPSRRSTMLLGDQCALVDRPQDAERMVWADLPLRPFTPSPRVMKAPVVP